MGFLVSIFKNPIKHTISVNIQENRYYQRNQQGDQVPFPKWGDQNVG